MHSNSILSQTRLKEILHYDHRTGIFTWLVLRQGIRGVGKIAGSLENGYVRIRVDGNCYRAHRLAWLYVYGTFPPDSIDHIDHMRCNNSITNLRLATCKVNNKNASKHKSNTSGTTGVYWHEQTKKWRAMISVYGKLTHLGLFTRKYDAVAARETGNIKYGFHKNHGGI